jgi:AbrB family looped-hinge helix DNA binding protein
MKWKWIRKIVRLNKYKTFEGPASSLYVNIPRKLAKKMNISSGDIVEIRARGRRIIVSPVVVRHESKRR